MIRYDLEYLGLCPCMVDVEIIDAKNDNQSIFVSAGMEACICSKVGRSSSTSTSTSITSRCPLKSTACCRDLQQGCVCAYVCICVRV